MTRRRKFLVLSLGAVLLAAACLGGYALRATQQVRPFYAAAVQAPAEQLETAAQRMEERVDELVSEPKPPGPWETIFTDDEVNGWLATILREKYTDLLPPEVVDPRVAFQPDRCMIGYRYRGKSFETVVSIEGTASMPAQDQVAVRLHRAFAGVLPIPMSRVVKEIAQGAERLKIPIAWGDKAGDPVLLVSVANALSTAEERRQLERIELRQGALVLTGSAEPNPAGEQKVALQGGGAASRPRLAR